MVKPIRTLDYEHFIIEENPFGYQSFKDGKPLVFSSTEQECSTWTHKLLAAQQDGEW